MATGDPGVQPVDIDVEFPNWPKTTGPIPSDTPIDVLPAEPKYPLNDYVDDRQLERPPINPDAKEVPAPARGNDIASIDDHIPHYGDTPDYLEAQQSKAMEPATSEIGHHMLGIVTGVYDDIKRFMETGDEKAAIRVAGALATGGTFAAEKNAVGAFGGMKGGNGVPIGRVSAEQKQYIKEMREQGLSIEDIADKMTRYHTPSGIRMEPEQVKEQLKKMGVDTSIKPQFWTDAMKFDLQAYDTPIFGVRPTMDEITKAMMKKYPRLTEEAVRVKISRQRALNRFKTEEAPAGKKLNEDTGLTGNKATTTEGQGELDLQQIQKTITPEQQAGFQIQDAPVRQALQNWQRAVIAVKKGTGNPEKERLLGVLYTRTKALSDTYAHIAKESKNDISGVQPIAEAMAGRIAFFKEEIAKVNEQLAKLTEKK